MIDLCGGEFLMGSEDADANPGDGEGPVRPTRVAPFRIAPKAVTNTQFAAFIDATGYRTGAERFGWSFVFCSFVPPSAGRTAQRLVGVPWWCAVKGAFWAAPEGPGSNLEARWDHPVVHIDHADAQAFCEWSGTRLPSEVEWEFAARGGLEGMRFPWGNELTPGGRHCCNIWQGQFPTDNTVEDGFLGTAPVDAFEPNGYGLYNVSGNVWEWCANWWTTEHKVDAGVHLSGPARGATRVMRGGSYLCHNSYCNRYRVAARTSNEPDSSSGNVGFRVAQDA